MIYVRVVNQIPTASFRVRRAANQAPSTMATPSRTFKTSEGFSMEEATLTKRFYNPGFISELGHTREGLFQSLKSGMKYEIAQAILFRHGIII